MASRWAPDDCGHSMRKLSKGEEISTEASEFTVGANSEKRRMSIIKVKIGMTLARRCQNMA